MIYKKRDVSVIHSGASGKCSVCETIVTLESTDKVGQCKIEDGEDIRGRPEEFFVWEILCPNCSNLRECSKKRQKRQ